MTASVPRRAMRSLASRLPQSPAEWSSLLQAALVLPIDKVWYPEHFYLHQIQAKTRFSPQKTAHGLGKDRPSAVLLLLSPCSASGEFQDMCITLTKRSNTVGSHKGQMSLPGGRLNESETTLQAAQRESLEEVGVPSSCYTELGHLTPISTNATGSPVTPHVAVASSPVQPWPASPDEVASIHYLHLSNLLLRATETHGQVIKYHSFTSREPSYFPCFFASDGQSTPAGPIEPSPRATVAEWDAGYAPMLPEDYPGQLVWGLTSFVMCEFIARVAAMIEARCADEPRLSARALLRASNVLARDPDDPEHL